MATQPSNAGRTHHRDVGRKIPLSNFQRRAQKGRERQNKGLRANVVGDGELPWLRASGALYKYSSWHVNLQRQDQAELDTVTCHLRMLIPYRLIQGAPGTKKWGWEHACKGLFTKMLPMYSLKYDKHRA